MRRSRPLRKQTTMYLHFVLQALLFRSVSLCFFTVLKCCTVIFFSYFICISELCKVLCANSEEEEEQTKGEEAVVSITTNISSWGILSFCFAVFVCSFSQKKMNVDE